jgi:hypothetical protein
MFNANPNIGLVNPLENKRPPPSVPGGGVSLPSVGKSLKK